MAVTGRNRRRPPGNARTMGVKDKPSNSRRRPPSNAKKMTVDKAKVMEASKSGKGTVSAKDKKTLKNASIRKSKPVTPKNKANTSKKTPAKKPATPKQMSLNLPKGGGKALTPNSPQLPKKNPLIKTVGKSAANGFTKGGVIGAAIATTLVGTEIAIQAQNKKSNTTITKNLKRAGYNPGIKPGLLKAEKPKPKKNFPQGNKASSVVKPKVTAPAKKSTVTPKKAVSKPVTSPKTATSGWKSQTAPKTKARLAKGNPTQARPKPTPIKPKKSKLPSSAQFIQDSPWDD